MTAPLDLFHSAFHAKDVDAALKALASLDDQATAPLLAKLLLEHWHEAHEDIVFELGLIGESSTTAAIARAAEMRFEYLIDWDNLHAFQCKCAYALARIGTTESKVALELIAKHSDPMLREYGQEGLDHWPIPYKGGDVPIQGGSHVRSVDHVSGGSRGCGAASVSAGSLCSQQLNSFRQLCQPSSPRRHLLRTMPHRKGDRRAAGLSAHNAAHGYVR